MSSPLPAVPAPPARRKLPPTFHRVTVEAIEELTPRMRRITFGGADLATYPNDGPATHFKVLLAPDGGRLELPEVTPDWTGWPSGEGQPIRRTYTPRYVDNAASRLVIDFALHPGAGAGPASRWAEAATVGTQTVVTGGRGAYRIDETADWTVMVGDETALPAIGTVLEDAAARGIDRPIIVIAEVLDATDEIELPLTGATQLHWVHRGDGGAGELGAQALIDAALPSGAGRAWVGLEAAAMRTARRHLLHERGFDRSALHTRAYWKRGMQGHRDSDSGEDVD